MKSFRPALIVATVALATATHAETLWLTVVGDPADAGTNTVQVDPVLISVDGPIRLMRIRLNHAAQTASPQGVKFRSFQSIVEFDCDVKSARYVHTEFHAAPLWKGAPHTTVDYKAGELPPMVLREMKPNPAERIIKAACSIELVQSK